MKTTFFIALFLQLAHSSPLAGSYAQADASIRTVYVTTTVTAWPSTVTYATPTTAPTIQHVTKTPTPTSVGFIPATPAPNPAVVVSLGNSQNTDTSVLTGKGGLFGGNGGSANNVKVSSGNTLQAAGNATGSVSMGNTNQGKVNLNTGKGAGFGDGGDVANVNMASGNTATAQTAQNIAASIGSAENDQISAWTGKGGILGGDGGYVDSLSQSSQNNVNLDKASKGQVGVTVGGNMAADTGNGKLFGSAEGINNGKQASNNVIE